MLAKNEERGFVGVATVSEIVAIDNYSLSARLTVAAVDRQDRITGRLARSESQDRCSDTVESGPHQLVRFFNKATRGSGNLSLHSKVPVRATPRSVPPESN